MVRTDCFAGARRRHREASVTIEFLSWSFVARRHDGSDGPSSSHKTTWRTKYERFQEFGCYRFLVSEFRGYIRTQEFRGRATSRLFPTVDLHWYCLLFMGLYPDLGFMGRLPVSDLGIPWAVCRDRIWIWIAGYYIAIASSSAQSRHIPSCHVAGSPSSPPPPPHSWAAAAPPPPPQHEVGLDSSRRDSYRHPTPPASV